MKKTRVENTIIGTTSREGYKISIDSGLYGKETQEGVEAFIVLGLRGEGRFFCWMRGSKEETRILMSHSDEMLDALAEELDEG
jgi:hypothetical protein